MPQQPLPANEPRPRLPHASSGSTRTASHTTRTGPPTASPRGRDIINMLAIRALGKYLDRARSASRFTRKLPIYNTEFGLQSNPPDRLVSTSLSRQAALINEKEEYSYRYWRLKSHSQYLLYDDPARPGSLSAKWSGFQTGLRFASGKKKPAYNAYRFPIVVQAARAAACYVWGRVRPGVGPRFVRLYSARAAASARGSRGRIRAATSASGGARIGRYRFRAYNVGTARVLRNQPHRAPTREPQRRRLGALALGAAASRAWRELRAAAPVTTVAGQRAPVVDVRGPRRAGPRRRGDASQHADELRDARRRHAAGRRSSGTRSRRARSRAAPRFDAADPGAYPGFGPTTTSLRRAKDAGLSRDRVPRARRAALGDRGQRARQPPRPSTRGRIREEFADFAEAVARRYSGDYEDVPRSSGSPIWNEPNHVLFLKPQRESPRIYRRAGRSRPAARSASTQPTPKVLVGETAPRRQRRARRSARPSSCARWLCLDEHFERARGGSHVRLVHAARRRRLRASPVRAHAARSARRRTSSACWRSAGWAATSTAAARAGRMPLRPPDLQHGVRAAEQPAGPDGQHDARAPGRADQREGGAVVPLPAPAQLLAVPALRRPAARPGVDERAVWSGFQTGLRFTDGRAQAGLGRVPPADRGAHARSPAAACWIWGRVRPGEGTRYRAARAAPARRVVGRSATASRPTTPATSRRACRAAQPLPASGARSTPGRAATAASSRASVAAATVPPGQLRRLSSGRRLKRRPPTHLLRLVGGRSAPSPRSAQA